MPNLSDAQEDEMPPGTAVVLTALGRVNEPSVMRTVMGYEAHWLRREKALGPLYRGLRTASMQARIIATARAFNDKLTPAAGATALPADEAIAELEQAATDAADRTALRLLIGALGLFPTGTLVELSTGEVAIVVQTPASPALYSQPQVRIVLDATGGSLARPVAIDLAQRPGRGEPPRHIRKVVATSGRSVGRLAPRVREQHPGSAGGRTDRSAAGRRQRKRGALAGARRLRRPVVADLFAVDADTDEPAAFDPDARVAVHRLARLRASGPDADLDPRGRRSGRRRARGRSAPRQRDARDDELGSRQAPRRADHRGRGDVAERQTPHFGAARERRDASRCARRRGPAKIERSRRRRRRRGARRLVKIRGRRRAAEREEGDRGGRAREGTPLVHLTLVYMLDQQLTGTTVFQSPDGVEARGRLRGRRAREDPDRHARRAPLDRVIVERGLLDEATLKGTMLEVSRKRILHGRHLVLQGLLERETVIELLRLQLVRKMNFLFELPPATRYAYYEGENLLASYGGPELTPVEPLSVIMGGIRLRAQDAVVDATLARVVGRPLALHRDAEVRRFDLQRDEMGVTDVLRGKRMTLAELIDSGVSQERIVKMVVYALAITRSLDLGVPGRPPVGIGRAVVEAPFAKMRATEAKPKSEPERAAQPAPGRTGFGLGFGRPAPKPERRRGASRSTSPVVAPKRRDSLVAALPALVASGRDRISGRRRGRRPPKRRRRLRLPRTAPFPRPARRSPGRRIRFAVRRRLEEPAHRPRARVVAEPAAGRSPVTAPVSANRRERRAPPRSSSGPRRSSARTSSPASASRATRTTPSSSRRISASRRPGIRTASRATSRTSAPTWRASSRS